MSGDYELFSTPAEIMTLLLSKDENPNQFFSILSEAVVELDGNVGNKGKEGSKDQAKWVTRELLERYAWDIPVSEKANKSKYYYCIKNNDNKGYIVGGTNKYLCKICKNALNFEILNWKLYPVTHGMVWKYRYPGCLSCKAILWSPKEIKNCYRCYKRESVYYACKRL